MYLTTDLLQEMLKNVCFTYFTTKLSYNLNCSDWGTFIYQIFFLNICASLIGSWTSGIHPDQDEGRWTLHSKIQIQGLL